MQRLYDYDEKKSKLSSKITNSRNDIKGLIFKFG